MVEYFEEIGFEIVNKDDDIILFKDPNQNLHKFEILKMFPFSSTKKRMGIIVKELSSEQDVDGQNIEKNPDFGGGKITFYLKGADSVMKARIQNHLARSDLEEKVHELAVQGLRTLVFSKKPLSEQSLKRFEN